MSVIDTITVANFKTQFPRFTPVYLPVWDASKVYFKDNVVYYQSLFYKSLKDNNTSLPTVATDWVVINQNVLNYTQDDDITKAMAEARVNFNEGLFGSIDEIKLAFLYLTAYYLTVDFQNALNANNGLGMTQSKSVGSVSESYAIPQWMLKSPVFSLYAQNGYGRKYLSLIAPRLTGNVMFFKGNTTAN